ncbi:MAG: hypothetical protein WBM09_01400 [Gallionella sp.]
MALLSRCLDHIEYRLSSAFEFKRTAAIFEIDFVRNEEMNTVGAIRWFAAWFGNVSHDVSNSAICNRGNGVHCAGMIASTWISVC